MLLVVILVVSLVVNSCQSLVMNAAICVTVTDKVRTIQTVRRLLWIALWSADIVRKVRTESLFVANNVTISSYGKDSTPLVVKSVTVADTVQLVRTVRTEERMPKTG
jgi:hypothetical protein